MSGSLWKFSDQLDDADRIMIQKDFITLNEGVEYYGLGMKPFTRFAREAGAVYKIGKMVRIRRDLLEEYLRQIQKKVND
ncbi:MAG: DUF6462 family protein [Lachnospiraceae bacterium]|nr:DUF6462 family protein [Lachnospiraceae bacterium]